MARQIDRYTAHVFKLVAVVEKHGTDLACSHQHGDRIVVVGAASHRLDMLVQQLLQA